MTPPADTPSGQAVVRIVTSTQGLLALRDAWDALLDATPAVSGFQSAVWVTKCWLELDNTMDALYTAVATDGAEPVAIFPMQLSRGGRLSFIGERVSNYSGPVYLPQWLDDSLGAWIAHLEAAPEIKTLDLSGVKEESPVFRALSGRSVPRWGRPLTTETIVCPEVDLADGWEALYQHHSRKHRSSWRRLERRLSTLGPVEFRETGDPLEVAAAFPRIARLYEARWTGKRVAPGLAGELEHFHANLAVAAAQAGHVSLALLTLDGEIIAFSYGIRAHDVTVSYMVAHDAMFDRYSAGLLLLMRILRTAADRGDPAYDFSLGRADYKAKWATRERGVFRLLWGQGRWRRTVLSRTRTRARSIPALTRVKQEGLRGLCGQRSDQVTAPDSPGLAAGDQSSWSIFRVVASASEGPRTDGSGWVPRFAPATYASMRRSLSARMLALAVERSFRGDELLITEDEQHRSGVVWRAAATRREVVLGGRVDALETSVYYHPSAAQGFPLERLVEGLAGEQSCLVVSPRPLQQSSRIVFVASLEVGAVDCTTAAAVR